MSNNQESVSMSNTEEQREKMKKELEKVGMYQPNVPYDYMKQVFDVLQESREMSNNTANQKDLSSHSINDITNKSDVTIKGGDSISETDNNRAKPSCSYNTHCNNVNSESPKPRNKRNNKKKCTDDNDGSDNGVTMDKNMMSRLRSKNNSQLQECCNLREDNKKMSSIQKDFQYHNNRWKINPLDSQSNPNDVSLQQPKRSSVQERLPFRLCKGTHTEEESIKIMNDLNNHLKNMANLLSCHGTTELKFQWGTPIQVDTDNNSFGRIPSMVNCYYDEEEDIDMINNYEDEENLINNNNNNNSDNDDNLTNNYDRVNKRKASWLITNSKLSNSSSDDDMSLSLIKKPKSEDKCQMYKNKLQRKDNSSSSSLFKRGNKLDYCTNEDSFTNNNNNLVNEEKMLNKDTDLNKSLINHGPNERTMISSEILSNSRRDDTISMSDTNKTQLSSSLTLRSSKKVSNNRSNNRNLDDESPSTSRKENSTGMLLTNKYKEQLKLIDRNINDDDDDDDDEETMIKDNIVIKPLPMNNFSTKLARQCAILKQTDAERKKKMLLDKEEALRMTKEENDRKKQEYVKRRMEEMAKEKLKVKDKEKNKNRLMEVLEAKSTSRTTRWRDQRKKLTKKQRKEDSEIDEEEEEEEEEDIEKIIEEIENDEYIYTTHVTCPICNKLFPSDQIENHAAMCDQFQTEDDYQYSTENSKQIVKGKVKKSQMLYECNICSSFKTYNGIDYEDHVNKCLQSRQHSPPRGTPVLIDVPDSPISSFQSISEQKNSSIDYNDQLNNITKKAQVGRKRRR